MKDEDIKVFLDEVRNEQHLSPFREDDEFISYIKDGIYNINHVCGKKIDYNIDLDARRLLKNYVLYADYKRLAEFKEKYVGDYDALQRKYYIDSSL